MSEDARKRSEEPKAVEEADPTITVHKREKVETSHLDPLAAVKLAAGRLTGQPTRV